MVVKLLHASSSSHLLTNFSGWGGSRLFLFLYFWSTLLMTTVSNLRVAASRMTTRQFTRCGTKAAVGRYFGRLNFGGVMESKVLPIGSPTHGFQIQASVLSTTVLS